MYQTTAVPVEARGASESLEVKLQTVVSLHVGAGNQTESRHIARAVSANCWAFSPSRELYCSFVNPSINIAKIFLIYVWKNLHHKIDIFQNYRWLFHKPRGNTTSNHVVYNRQVSTYGSQCCVWGQPHSPKPLLTRQKRRDLGQGIMISLTSWFKR